ncbi:hypothetical protein [Chryseobacterium cucumeris]|uniref:hypothetical protein n=1 Tax=Chryseobacterium cucumeris TaxID=1813611 RepID=UPI0037C14448
MSKDIFKRNPNIPEAFITSDNEEFYTKNAAENHAKTLKDKTIKHLTNPSEKVAIVEESNQIFVQTGENQDGSPKVEAKTAEITVNNLPPKIEALVNVLSKNNLTTVAAKVTEILEKGAAAGTDTGNQNSAAAGDNTDKTPKTEVKLTAKQQAQADYTTKFGEVPADEFTKNELLEAIEKGEKLVADIKND